MMSFVISVFIFFNITCSHDDIYADKIILYVPSFQAHRALLIISEIVATAGFILIFVALKDRGGVVDLSNVSEQ